jgi:hypothetical protein
MRDDFNLLIVNIPFIYSNIPAAPAYGGSNTNPTKNTVISGAPER